MASMDSLTDEEYNDLQKLKQEARENIKKQEDENDEEEEDDQEELQDELSSDNEEIQQQKLKSKKIRKQRPVVVPKDLRKQTYRACFICHLVKNIDQFNKDGCENCREDLQNNQSNIDQKYMLVKYTGHIAILNAATSWVASKITKQIGKSIVPGLYALHVNELDQGYMEDLNDSQIPYVQNSKM